MPLHTGERPIGALGFRFAPGHTFSADDRALVSSLGDHCAQALERARLYDAEHRAREALGLLATVGERLAGTLDPDDALRTLASLVVPAISDQCVVDLRRARRDPPRSSRCTPIRPCRRRPACWRGSRPS